MTDEQKDEQGWIDNYAHVPRHARSGFGHGPLAGTRYERLAWIAKLLIEKETGEEAYWIWNCNDAKNPYGGLYPSLTAMQSSAMIHLTDEGGVKLLVSVGRDNRQGWIDRLHAAGHAQAMTPQDDDGYPGKVLLILGNPLDLADETVRAFISTPWCPRKGNA